MKPSPDAYDSPASVTIVAGPERPSRTRRLLYGAGLLLAGGALATALRPAPPETPLATLPPQVIVEQSVQPVVLPPRPQPVSQEAPTVEVAFVLDTTGSMGGLLRAAKKKVWSIANELADADPRPRIVLSLVAYRDHGDAYVTQKVELTEDLDAFYAALEKLKPMGGGDHPEAVADALETAVDGLAWTGEAKLRFLFLVGDAPHHSKDLQRCQAALTKARQKGILVNSIQCGDDDAARAAFSQFAQAGGGNFLQIDQHAQVVAVNTPFDGQIAAAQREIEGTALFFGTVGQQKASLAQWSMNSSLGAEEYASRASCLSKTNGYYTQDLLAALDEGRVELRSLKSDQLPEELKGLKPSAREARLAELRAEREAAKARLSALVAQRDAYLREQGGGEGTFDRKLMRLLTDQTSKAGFSFDADAK